MIVNFRRNLCKFFNLLLIKKPIAVKIYYQSLKIIALLSKYLLITYLLQFKPLFHIRVPGGDKNLGQKVKKFALTHV